MWLVFVDEVRAWKAQVLQPRWGGAPVLVAATIQCHLYDMTSSSLDDVSCVPNHTHPYDSSCLRSTKCHYKSLWLKIVINGLVSACVLQGQQCWLLPLLDQRAPHGSRCYSLPHHMTIMWSISVTLTLGNLDSARGLWVDWLHALLWWKSWDPLTLLRKACVAIHLFGCAGAWFCNWDHSIQVTAVPFVRATSCSFRWLSNSLRSQTIGILCPGWARVQFRCYSSSFCKFAGSW
jgi:hypothetical protein